MTPTPDRWAEPAWHARRLESLSRFVHRLRERRGAPLIVALDGPSGCGKTTVAGTLAPAISAVVVPVDDFFAAELTRTDWDARTPSERARDAIDWRRLRALVIEPLRAGRPAVWHPFDFTAGERPDGSYGIASETVQRDPAPVVLLDGAYSSQPALADVLDATIYVETPQTIRRSRLAARESAAFLAAWHARWDDAEAHYFSILRPPESFDAIVETATGVVRERRLVTNDPSSV